MGALAAACMKAIHVEVGRGMAREYSGCVKELRTLRQHEVDYETAVQTQTTPHGVKEPSILMLLPIFDITSSFTFDYLHTVLLGVKNFYGCLV